ncbi:MAG: DNA primase, partial [Cyclobacteriaceae bacterium]
KNGSEEVKKTVVDLISERHEVSSLWFDRYKIFVPGEEDLLHRMFYTNMARLKRSIIQKLIDDHKEKLKNTSDPDEIDELLHIQQELKRTEKELADFLGIVIPK